MDPNLRLTIKRPRGDRWCHPMCIYTHPKKLAHCDQRFLRVVQIISLSCLTKFPRSLICNTDLQNFCEFLFFCCVIRQSTGFLSTGFLSFKSQQVQSQSQSKYTINHVPEMAYWDAPVDSKISDFQVTRPDQQLVQVVSHLILKLSRTSVV